MMVWLAVALLCQLSVCVVLVVTREKFKSWTAWSLIGLYLICEIGAVMGYALHFPMTQLYAAGWVFFLVGLLMHLIALEAFQDNGEEPSGGP